MTDIAPVGDIDSTDGNGWVYQVDTCKIWANTNVNGETPCNPCTPGCITENCY